MGGVGAEVEEEEGGGEEEGRGGDEEGGGGEGPGDRLGRRVGAHGVDELNFS